MSRHVPPPKTVCPECRQRSGACEIKRVWSDDVRSTYQALFECPKCHKKTPAACWCHYTPEEAKANEERKDALGKAYDAAHRKEARERKQRWYECNGDLVRSSKRRRWASDPEYRLEQLKRQRERYWSKKEKTGD